MPNSRGRKKNKKSPKKKQLSKKLNRDAFEKDGIKIVREGKKITFKNIRNPEQQTAFIEQLKENRPKQLEFIEQNIEKVIEIFREYDNLKLLGGLCYNQFDNQSNSNDDGLSEVTLELGLSFSTAIPNNPEKEPTPSIVNKLIDNLISIRNGYRGYMMSEHITGRYSDIESRIRLKLILEALYVRGIGYPKHLYLIYKELFSGHDNFLTEKYGFNSTDLFNTIHQLENSFHCRAILQNGLPHPANHLRFVQWTKDKTQEQILSSPKHFIDLFGDENPDLIIENTKIHGYRIDQIETYPELFKIRFRYPYEKLVVSTISQKFGDNTNFLNPKFKGLPLNDSTITSRPIIEFNGDYFLFSFSLPTRCLFEISEYLIEKADKKYYNEKFLGNKYSNSRDNFLELKTAELFKKIIPNSQSFLNLKYKPGQRDENGNLIETELDLLIISKYANYLVEMKAGGLSAPSKRGALKSLLGQLKETVGYGAYQNYRALNFINTTSSPVFYDNNGNTVIIDKTKKKFRITITMEHLGDLIAYMYDLKEIGIIDSAVDFAWTCSIFDLLIFSEVMESEADFLEYLEKRIPLYQRPELNFQDEIDILGYFLDENLEFDEKFIKELTDFQLNKYSSEIDDYFEKGGSKSKRKKISR